MEYRPPLLKIGFVLDDTLDSTDGVQQYVLTLGNWLSEQGHEVHYLAGQTKRRDIPRLHSLSRNVSVRFNGNRMSMPLPTSKVRLQQLLNQQQFDILHIQMPYSPVLGAKIIQATPLQTAIVGTFHILPLGQLQQVAARALAVWLRSSQKRISHIFSVSEPAKQFAESLGIETTVLPNVIPYTTYAKGKRLPAYKDSYNLVFLGRLVARKGAMEFLQAAEEVVARNHIANLKVIVCGTGPQAKKLQDWADTNWLRDHIVFTGYVAEEDKPQYLASADIAVFPSLGGESFGIVLLEAMAAGAGVVLAGDNPGYRSVLGSATPAALFDPRDKQAFADLIETVHAKSGLAGKLHAAQAALVQNYDVAVVGPELLKYYQAIALKRGISHEDLYQTQ